MDNKVIKNVLLCGLGAIGSIYAVRLHDAENISLRVLVDEDRKNKYTRSPLIFNDKEYNFDYVLPSDNDFKADLVLIATKNDGLKDAVKNIKNFVTPETIYLSLLNGLQSEEEIALEYGKENVLFCYYIGHTSTRQGRRVVHDGVYETVFGEKENKYYSKNVLAVKELFEAAKINYKIPQDMDYSRWWKFLVNVGYNQASAVLNASYGVFQKSEKANNFAINLMKEAVEIAKACGINNTEKLIPEVLEVIKTMLPDTRTSMLQDVDAGRKTEVDIFAGYICDKAEKYQIDTPYNRAVFDIISAIDEKNSL